MTSKLHKTFDRKRYTWYFSTKTRTEAKAVAEGIRANGKYARVSHMKIDPDWQRLLPTSKGKRFVVWVEGG
jgi:hypothetical protein